MSLEKEKYIKKLLLTTPRGAPITTKLLGSLGISSQLVQRYIKSGWLEKVSNGVYILPGQSVSWEGVLFTLQKQLNLPLHVGGRTALEKRGLGHFLPLGKQKICIFGPYKTLVPKWVSLFEFEKARFAFRGTNFLPQGLHIYQEPFQGFDLNTSSPERAAFEVALLVGKEHSFEEFLLLSENFSNFRPKVMQELFMKCASIYAKRLILLVGEFHDALWYKKVDLSLIDIGSGVRQICGGGHYVAKQLLSIPKPLEEFENV